MTDSDKKVSKSDKEKIEEQENDKYLELLNIDEIE